MHIYPAQSTCTILLVIASFPAFLLTAAATSKEKKCLRFRVIMSFAWLFLVYLVVFFSLKGVAVKLKASSHNEMYLIIIV